jgi:hypothetical protein
MDNFYDIRKANTVPFLDKPRSRKIFVCARALVSVYKLIDRMQKGFHL